jgi:hypothetical protein
MDGYAKPLTIVTCRLRGFQKDSEAPRGYSAQNPRSGTITGRTQLFGVGSTRRHLSRKPARACTPSRSRHISSHLSFDLSLPVSILSSPWVVLWGVTWWLIGCKVPTCAIAPKFDGAFRPSRDSSWNFRLYFAFRELMALFSSIGIRFVFPRRGIVLPDDSTKNRRQITRDFRTDRAYFQPGVTVQDDRNDRRSGNQSCGAGGGLRPLISGGGGSVR